MWKWDSLNLLRKRFYVQHLLRGKHKKWNDLRSKFSFNLFESAVSRGASVQQHGHPWLRWQRCSFQTEERVNFGVHVSVGPQTVVLHRASLTAVWNLPWAAFAQGLSSLVYFERCRKNTYEEQIWPFSEEQNSKSAASIFSHWYPSLSQWNHSSVREEEQSRAATMGTTNRFVALPVWGLLWLQAFLS